MSIAHNFLLTQDSKAKKIWYRFEQKLSKSRRHVKILLSFAVGFFSNGLPGIQPSRRWG